jgi:hypothetical protein
MGNPIVRPVPSTYYMKANENKNYYLTDRFGGLIPSIEDHNAFHFQVIVPIKTVNPLSSGKTVTFLLHNLYGNQLDFFLSLHVI